MKLPFKNVLVTGGAGFIGSHLVDTLVSAGCKVAVLEISTAAEGCEVIFHLAAIVSVPRTIEDPLDSAAVNDTGTLLVLDAAREKKARRVIFSSSCAVYGDDRRLPKQEDMNPKPQSPYAVQKLAAEYYARVYHELYGLEAVALRYFNVYGPKQDPSSPYSGVISIFMAKALHNEPAVIYGDGNQSRDFIYVQDVVRANLLAATAKGVGGQVMNIGTGRSVVIKQLWKTICALSGQNLEPEYAPKRPGDIIESVAGIGSAKALLGFEPEISFEKGLESTFEWYRKSNKQKK
jgi:UDP-glucose 4-epimerase